MASCAPASGVPALATVWPGERRGVADGAARERDERVERARDERADRHEPRAAVAGGEQLRLRRDRDGRAAALERAERVARRAVSVIVTASAPRVKSPSACAS